MPDSVLERGARKSARRNSQIVRACVCLLVISCGLALRNYGFGVGLPGFVVKYGASALWGTMLFLLLGIAVPGLKPKTLVPLAITIAVAVELFRLVHSPWLDAFRLTLAGALLLGRIFSFWDMLAYGIGIVLGAVVDRLAIRASEKTAGDVSHSPS
jgi:Protein of unknown function (DUF2809)